MRAFLWRVYIRLLETFYQLQPHDRNSVIFFDTSIHTLNVGDNIINYYCSQVLEGCLKGKHFIRVSTHVLPNEHELKTIKRTPLKIVCGTNLLSPDYAGWSLWKMPRHLNGYHNTIALGIGWGFYSDTFTEKSKDVYQFVFGKRGLHSVRDSYTEKKLREMGIENVINTGCPTLWNLTPEHCASIPTQKASRVVTTLTDYSKDIDADNYLLSVLNEQYEEVFIWPQGSTDLEYISQLHCASKAVVLPNDLDQFTHLLQEGNIDYVGTRLHGGIHALNNRVRTLIIAVDNRAIEMGNDFLLPYIKRSEVKDKLEPEINAIRKTGLTIPWDNIKKWKAQFHS